jgi:diguanylate cyclase (GGDEF)-like protein
MDPLTGLSNTRAFTEIASAEIDRMHRFGKPLSAAYLDLDNFKRVNDQNGHKSGDGALRLIGDALSHCVRSIDTAARVGGDEFVLLMPETDRDGARVVVRRLQQRVTELSLGKITCSMGCVTFTAPPRDVDHLLKAADDAMYAAKRSGRDRVVFADGGRPSGEGASAVPRSLPE